MTSTGKIAKKQHKTYYPQNQMMEFWSDSRGQSQSYPRAGTIPGRNSQSYHETSRHPPYYEDQQHPSRNFNYWTVPAPKTGGAPREHTNWMDTDLAISSNQFPFVLDRHADRHCVPGVHQQHEAQSREWSTPHEARRDYDREFPGGGWQRWGENTALLRYHREASVKRRENSYRELEAWAARYSHSLPRKRRIEAELRGASNRGVRESCNVLEKDRRSGTDPQVTSQHLTEMWYRRGRQAPKYNPIQLLGPDTSHTLGTKENIYCPSKTFSQPPVYNAPPSYSSSHRSSPVLQQTCTSLERGVKRGNIWSHRQDVCTDLQDMNEREEETPKPEMSSSVKAALESAVAQKEEVIALLHSQVAQTSNTSQEFTSKVIEGRKFRLDRKAGRMTIFCLVSRIADASETLSTPRCIPPQNSRGTEEAEDVQVKRLSDEVDFGELALTNISSSSDKGNSAGDNSAETDSVFSETTDGKFTTEQEASQSLVTTGVRYPLWKEPSLISKEEVEGSSASGLKINGEESDPIQQDVAKIGQQLDVEETKLVTEGSCEDGKGLLVIDTTCVVVKVDVIPSPIKEDAQYSHKETSLFNDGQLSSPSDQTCWSNQEREIDRNKESPSVRKNRSQRAEFFSSFMGTEDITAPVPSYASSEQPSEEEPTERASKEFQLEQGASIVKDQDGDMALSLFAHSEEKTIDDKASACESRECKTEGTAAEEETSDQSVEKKTYNQSDDDLAKEPSEDLTDETETQDNPKMGPNEGETDPQDNNHANNQEAGEDLEDFLKPQEDMPENSTTYSCLATSGAKLSQELCIELAIEIVSNEPSQTESFQPPPQAAVTTNLTLPLEILPSCSSDSSSNIDPLFVMPSSFTDPVSCESCDSPSSSPLHINHSSETPSLSSFGEGDAKDQDDKPPNLPQNEVYSESLPGAEEIVSQQHGCDETALVANSVSEEQETKEVLKEMEQSETFEDEHLRPQDVQDPAAQSSKRDAQNTSDDPDDPEKVHQMILNLNQEEKECILKAKQPKHTEPISHDSETQVSSPPASSYSLDTCLDEPSPTLCASPVFPLTLEHDPTDVFSPSLSQNPYEESHPIHNSILADLHEVHTSSESLEASPYQQEPQYPESLWDVVNRIRKHTAPDSENEEEEMSELWELENTGEHLNSLDLSCEENQEKDVSGDKDKEQQPDDREPVGSVEEEALTCRSSSSNSSQVSDDTVIVADEVKSDDDKGTERTIRTEAAGENPGASETVKNETSKEV